MRTLIAGFGNVLRGDDGFGVEVIRRLQEREPISDVEVMEVGTAGIRLAQELLTPCDRLIIVDAMNRGGTPGAVYVVRVESVDAAGEVDLHLAVPARALAVAKALRALPPRRVERPRASSPRRGAREGGRRRLPRSCRRARHPTTPCRSRARSLITSAMALELTGGRY